MKKSKIRLFINKQLSSNLMIYVKGKQHHYLKNVMRIQINDTIRIFDGKTGEWSSQVLSINRDNIVLSVNVKIKEIIKDSDVWLIFSPIKQYRMNLVVQKATELGASKLIPCITEYANIRLVNLQNLKKNAIEASEQSERLDIPNIEKPIQIESLLSSWPDDRYLIYCDEKLYKTKNIFESLLPIQHDTKKYAVLVGPEGGFSNSEKELIMNIKKVLPISLGNKLLRSDTAITVALFCVQELIKDK